jgi:hypothetical protein
MISFKCPVFFAFAMTATILSLSGSAMADRACTPSDPLGLFGPVDQDIASTVGVVSKELAVRKIIPEYKYVPALWGDKLSYVPPKTYSASTPGSYYSSTSALWGAFGSKTYYSPGTSSEFTTGGYFQTAHELIRPERFTQIKSRLTDLPYTPSDLELFKKNLRDTDFSTNGQRAIDLFKSFETAQTLKRLVTGLIESPDSKLNAAETRELQDLEHDYISRTVHKNWESREAYEKEIKSNGRYQGVACVGLALYPEVCPAGANGLASREAFFTDLMNPGMRKLENLYAFDEKQAQHQKLVALLVEASRKDSHADYWETVDSLIRDSNYDRFLYESADMLTEQIQARKMNSLGGLLRKLDFKISGAPDCMKEAVAKLKPASAEENLSLRARSLNAFSEREYDRVGAMRAKPDQSPAQGPATGKAATHAVGAAF